MCHAAAMVVHVAEIALTRDMVLRHPKAVQPDGFFLVFCHATAIVIHHGEVEHAIDIALFCGQAIPFDGFLIALRHTTPAAVHQANIGLAFRMALLCRKHEPLGGFIIIFGPATTCEIDGGELELGLCIASLGFLKQVRRLRDDQRAGEQQCGCAEKMAELLFHGVLVNKEWWFRACKLNDLLSWVSRH